MPLIYSMFLFDYDVNLQHLIVVCNYFTIIIFISIVARKLQIVSIFAYMARKKTEDPKNNVPLRLRDSLRKKVEKVAAKEDRSLSYLLEKAIEEKYA